jgi:hypothetical protein
MICHLEIMFTFSPGGVLWERRATLVTTKKKGKPKCKLAAVTRLAKKKKTGRKTRGGNK